MHYHVNIDREMLLNQYIDASQSAQNKKNHEAFRAPWLQLRHVSSGGVHSPHHSQPARCTASMANPALMAPQLQEGDIFPTALSECVGHDGKKVTLAEHRPFAVFLYPEVCAHCETTKRK